MLASLARMPSWFNFYRRIISKGTSRITILGCNNCIDGIDELVPHDWLAIKLTKVSFSEEDPWQSSVMFNDQAVGVNHCSCIHCKMRCVWMSSISIRSLNVSRTDRNTKGEPIAGLGHGP